MNNKMDASSSNEPNLILESKRLCIKFAQRLPTDFLPPLDARFVSPSGNNITTKIPSKVVAVVGSLGYRAKDFAEISCELLERNKVVPGSVIARSLMETTALVYLTHKKMKTTLTSGNIIELDDFLVKCMSGNRINSNEPDSPNILTAIAHLDKEAGYEKYADFYNVLCEFAHPNSLGTFYAYSEFHSEDYRLTFGENKGLTTANTIAFAVGFALEVLIEFYDRTLAILPQITALSVKHFDDSN